MSASVTPVRGHVRLVAGVDLIGYEPRPHREILWLAIRCAVGGWLAGGIAHAALGLWA